MTNQIPDDAQSSQVTDAMVERAWAAIVGSDVAPICFQASIIRADLKTGLQAAIAAQPPAAPVETGYNLVTGERDNEETDSTYFRSSAETASPRPCPFCGSKDLTLTVTPTHWKVVQCDDCGAQGPCIDLDDDEYIDRWDKRIPDEPQATPALNVKSICESTKDRRCIEVWLADPVTPADRTALTSALSRPQRGGE